jgi:hypothetical protein
MRQQTARFTIGVGGRRREYAMGSLGSDIEPTDFRRSVHMVT